MSAYSFSTCHDGYVGHGTRDVCMKSFASLVMFSGPSEAKSTKSSIYQLPPLVFMWVGDSLCRHLMTPATTWSGGSIAAMGREISGQLLGLQGVYPSLVEATSLPRGYESCLNQSLTPQSRDLHVMAGRLPRTPNSSLHDLNSPASLCLSSPAGIGLVCRLLRPWATANWCDKLGILLARG